MDTIALILVFAVVIGILMSVLGMRRDRKPKSVKEVYTVNEITFAGDDAEEFAKLYATACIMKGSKAVVKVPGCPEVDARDVWDIDFDVNLN